MNKKLVFNRKKNLFSFENTLEFKIQRNYRGLIIAIIIRTHFIFNLFFPGSKFLLFLIKLYLKVSIIFSKAYVFEIYPANDILKMHIDL